MLKSMTGFGRAETTIGNKKVTIEIKSLNSKGLDLNLKLPSFYRSKEVMVRTMLSIGISRGKCDFYINYEVLEGGNKNILNHDLLKSYYQDLKAFASDNNLPNIEQIDYLSIMMKMPDVMVSHSEDITDAEWKSTEELIHKAIEAFQNFRNEEGKSLYDDLLQRIESIASLLGQISQYENERIETVKERIQKNLQDISEPKNIDQNRFEQELIYYLEKYDVSEEKVRLKAHLDHFIQSMNDDSDKGKKLGFISQEIGREVNTLGSKANHFEMQKIVVEMKDELERIKEQVLNVL